MVVMVFAAHPDDEVLGPGGTIAKLAEKGKKIISVIFSYGSKFPPWEDEQKLIKIRVKESKKAGEIIGIKKTIFLGLKDTHIAEKAKEVLPIIVKLLKETKPDMVFMHSKNDTHPDHVAVNEIVTRAMEKVKINPEIYVFEISSFVNIFSTKSVEIVWDISDVLDKKLKALREFKSQSLLLNIIVPIEIAECMIIGRRYGFKYGEHFYSK